MRKINKIKSLCLLTAFVFASFGAKAQYSHLEISFFVPSFNIPTGDFGSGNNHALPLLRDNIGKDAGFGFGAGLRAAYKFDIGFGEVAPIAGVELFWNRLKSDTRDEYDNFKNGKAPFYINLPVLFGVNYRYNLTDVFTPFAEFGFGPDFMLISSEGYDGENGEENVLKYKPSASLAWQVGVGTYLKQHFSVGVHYYGLGNHKMRYRSSSDINIDDLGTQKRSIGSLVFRLGFHF